MNKLSGMKMATLAFGLAICAAFCASSQCASAQAGTGTLQFTVRITPSAGVAEPVRGLPFYLLRKSFAAIQQEAEASEAEPHLDPFIDALSVSPELKAWMKKHHTATLTGEDFVAKITPADVIAVPEFWKSYFEANVGDTNFGFPKKKYKESERAKSPEKYQHEVDDYHQKVKQYFTMHPESRESLESAFDSINPGVEWASKLASRRSRIHALALDLAQSKYLVAQTKTDANGNGGFINVPPGIYWLSSLNIEGQAGDVREKWDAAVQVRGGQTTEATLSNFDAVAARQ